MAAPDIEASLIEAFYASSDAKLREALVGVIGQHAYMGPTVADLLETARGAVDAQTRAAAATATALCAVPDAENILREWLFTEENTDVRVAIHGALQLLLP